MKLDTKIDFGYSKTYIQQYTCIQASYTNYVYLDKIKLFKGKSIFSFDFPD